MATTQPPATTRDDAALCAIASQITGPIQKPLLLLLARERAGRRAQKELLAQYQRDPFCTACNVDLRTLLAVDTECFAAAQGFEAIELSPLAPLGVCSSMALTSQNRVVSAMPHTEVVADPTNVLALECAHRMRQAPDAPVHLATSQRVVRAQAVPRLPGYAQHFRMFTLASGGIEAKDHAFTLEAVVYHVRTMLAALDRLERVGYAFGERSIDVCARPDRMAIGERIGAALGGLATQKPLDHDYYSGGLRYQIWVSPKEGPRLPLIDGGAFDWLAKIASNRRAVFVASGAGTQLMALRFRAPPS